MTKDVIELAREACGAGAEDPLQDGGMLMLSIGEMQRLAALVAARDRERLNFLCSTGKPRRIEHQKGLWRVYQDEAPAEAEHSDWRAMTYLFHATPDEAIDAAIRALNTEGDGNEQARP